VVISHEYEATHRLLEKVKYYIGNLKVKPGIKYETKQEITFPKLPSSFYIGTAGQRSFGRGDTIHRAHLSEVAFWNNAPNIISGITEAVPLSGKIRIESTPFGRGNWFYDECQKAKAHESSYTFHFYPWWLNQEYSAEYLTEEDRANLPPKIAELFLIPDAEFKLTDEENDLVLKNNLTIGQIKWRRYKVWDLGDLFVQEYPEDDVTCFLQSGRPVFRTVNISTQEPLVEKHFYLGGLDGAEGIENGDRHCFSLIDPWTKPAKTVFEIVSNEPIEIFDFKVSEICKKYSVKLGVEKNGIGVAHCQKLRDLGVDFEEWETTSASRPLMLVELEEALRKDELRECYLEAKNEFLDMVYDEKNRPTHTSGKHDDRVFSRAIAWQMRKSLMANCEVKWL